MIAAARFTNKAARHNTSNEQKKSGKELQKRNSVSGRGFAGSRVDRSSLQHVARIAHHLSVPSLQKSRSGSVPNLRNSNANEWGLKPEHVLALKVTWNKLCDSPHSTCRGISAIMEQAFNRLNEKNKILREIFYNAAFVDGMAERRGSHTIATLRDHSHFFISLISQVIQTFDSRSTDIFGHINKIGSYHAGLKKYGFRQMLWDRLGEELIDVLVVQDCVRGFPDACRAWTILIANLIDRLRAAAATNYASSNVTPFQRRWSSCLSSNLSRRTTASPPTSACRSDEEQVLVKSRPRFNTLTGAE